MIFDQIHDHAVLIVKCKNGLRKLTKGMELELQQMICILLVLYCKVNDIGSIQI